MHGAPGIGHQEEKRLPERLPVAPRLVDEAGRVVAVEQVELGLDDRPRVHLHQPLDLVGEGARAEGHEPEPAGRYSRSNVSRPKKPSAARETP